MLRETTRFNRAAWLKTKSEARKLQSFAVDHLDTNQGNKNDDNAGITKTRFIRPIRPRVFCDQCDEHKEGFRGEHELRRHKDARHQTRVKKFICVDPRKYGLPHNIRVVNPLSNCKACKAQKKYGAYYNAAAHLRRSHFRERFSRERKNSGANGGKGGGNWPPMQEMKNWMQEIWVLQGEPDRHNYNDQINRYDKLNKGDVGYGDNEFWSYKLKKTGP